MCFTENIMLYMTYSATISSKGQITLPAEIRRGLKLYPGNKITLVKRGDRVELAADSYNTDLKELRAQVKKQLQQNGTWGLPWEEVKSRADKARLEQYKAKHGTRAGY